jgi:hypothetical protein
MAAKATEDGFPLSQRFLWNSLFYILTYSFEAKVKFEIIKPRDFRVNSLGRQACGHLFIGILHKIRVGAL